MADKSISELVAATSIGSGDLFVLEQSGTAKKLTGQILENWLVSYADGHGGVQSFVLHSTNGTNPIVKTWRMTYADGTYTDIPVADGARGATGQASYLWIKYASQRPTNSSQMYDSPDNWIGIYSGTSSTAPTSYTDYTWFSWKGATGSTGATGASISSITRISGDGSPGTSNTYQINLDNGSSAGTFSVYNGLDGRGTVNSVDGVSVSANTDNVNLGAVRFNYSQSLGASSKLQARTNIGAAAPPITTSMSLPATAWSGAGPYTQTVNLSSGVGPNSKIDLQPDADTLQQLLDDGVAAMFVSNIDGSLTVYAIGAAPTKKLTIQATITEVTRS